MEINILNAFMNVVKNNIYDLSKDYIINNRANSMGSALEHYVLDMFANTFNITDKETKMKIINSVFSYTGSNSAPPDAIIRNGIGIEIKKIESRNAQLQLNSSYPKAKLYQNDTHLSRYARDAEDWCEKDFLYIIGYVGKNNNIKSLKELALIDASLYCADKETYEITFDNVKNGIESIEGENFEVTKELGRINKVDPLKITSLRIRGMWLLENPFKVFEYIYSPAKDSIFTMFGLISKDKYDNFHNLEEFTQLVEETDNLNVEIVKVENPNNPAQLIDAIKIIYEIK